MNQRTRLIAPLLAVSVVGISACGSTTTPTTAATTSAAAITASTTSATSTIATSTIASAVTTADPSTTSPSTTAASPAAGPAGGGFGMGGGTAPTATHAGLAYASVSSSENLDLWLPANATAATPLVIYIHGGAFKGGNSAMAGSKVQPLLDAGYAVASINYRLSGEALFPAAVQDSKAAVRWLRANAATYNLDPNRFAAWGESAGGNLVALLGTTSGQSTSLDDPALGNAGVSSAVQAVIDWYGPTDFAQMDTQAAAAGNKCTNPQTHDPVSSPESAYIGDALQTAKDLVAQANPITYIATATSLPPFSVAHGDADCNVPYQQSQILVDALQKAGADATLTILPDAQHADPQFDTKLLTPTITWLDTVLAK